MKKILIAIIVLLFFGKVTQAQDRSFNVSFNHVNYIGENTGSGDLLGLRISYEQVKEIFGRSGSWRSGFQFSAGNYIDNYRALRNSSFSSNSSPLPNQIEVIGETNYKSLQFELTQKMYFGNGTLQYGGIYLLAGFGINLIKREITYSFDNPNYVIDDSKEKPSETFPQIVANMGAGYEFHLEIINIFIESELNFPIISIHDFDFIESDFSQGDHKSFWISIGIRFHMR